MKKRTKLILFLGVSLQIPLLVYTIYILFNLFSDSCPNKDVLSWDANLRYIATLQWMDSIRNVEIHRAIFFILEAPTWPVLRNIVQSVFFSIFGHSQTLDVYITLGTSCLLLITVFHILFYGMKNRWFYPLVFLLAWSSILLSKPLVAYSLSAMLEIQGALFFAVSIYYFYWYLTKEPDKKITILFAIFSFALFQTKYPYGYMFLFSIVVFFLFLEPVKIFYFGIRYILYSISKGWKNISYLSIIILIITYILIPANYKVSKLPGYFKYSIVLILLSDFFYYFFKEKAELLRLGYSKLIGVIQYIFLPVIFWVMINPDRFTSSSSTIQHVQLEGYEVGTVIEKGWEYYTVFIRSLSMDAFTNYYAGIFIVFLLFTSVIIGIIQYRKTQILRIHFLYSFIIISIIAGITFLTPNHQARHIYHLYPSIIISCLFLITDIHIFKKHYIQFIFIFIFLVLNSSPLYSVLENRYSDYIICYTGKKTSDYELPRWIEKKANLELKNNTVIFNHIDPSHVNKADAELLISRIAYNKKLKIIFDPKIKQIKWKSFSELLVLGNKDCEPIFNRLYMPLLEQASVQYSIKTIDETEIGCLFKINMSH